MIFRGEEAVRISQTIEVLLKGYLLSLLAQNRWQPVFAPMGVDIAWTAQEAQRADSAGKPYILFTWAPKEGATLRRHIEGEGLKKGRKHFFSFEVDLVASEFSGSLKGAANPDTTNSKLLDFWDFAFNNPDQREELLALGLEQVEAEADTEQFNDLERINPQTLRFTAYAIP